jgi:hypothetical protein
MQPRLNRATAVAASLSLGLAAVVACPPAARADPTPVAATSARSEAEKQFNEGERAFDRGDFVHAAEAFERAYRWVPHTDALWNAARAWQRADEPARAATAYARFLREAPSSSADRSVATAELLKLAPHLGRIEVHGDGIDRLALDERPIEERVLYVNPGAHTLRAVVDGHLLEQRAEVAAGGVVSVVFEPPKPAPQPSPPSAPEPPRPRPPVQPLPEVEPRPSSGGVSPWFVAGGAALTAGAVAATVVSGISTLAARNAFEAHPTPSNLAAGESMQERTNLLLGASIGLGVATSAAAVWLVNWRSRDTGRTVRVGVAPTGAWASGRF